MRRIALGAALSFAATLAGAEPTVPPRRSKALLAWLKAGTYRASYTAEDLRAGRTEFRKGATMVKELYFGGHEQVVGYSVLTKVRRRSGRAGRGWLFYETVDGTGRGALFGRGLAVCTGCHRLGVDYLRSAFRP